MRCTHQGRISIRCVSYEVGGRDHDHANGTTTAQFKEGLVAKHTNTFQKNYHHSLCVQEAY